jgi:hypothetical protein
MMMVVTVMAVALHLNQTLSEDTIDCQMLFACGRQRRSGKWSGASWKKTHGVGGCNPERLPAGDCPKPGSRSLPSFEDIRNGAFA